MNFKKKIKILFAVTCLLGMNGIFGATAMKKYIPQNVNQQFQTKKTEDKKNKEIDEIEEILNLLGNKRKNVEDEKMEIEKKIENTKDEQKLDSNNFEQTNTKIPTNKELELENEKNAKLLKNFKPDEILKNLFKAHKEIEYSNEKFKNLILPELDKVKNDSTDVLKLDEKKFSEYEKFVAEKSSLNNNFATCMENYYKIKNNQYLYDIMKKYDYFEKYKKFNQDYDIFKRYIVNALKLLESYKDLIKSAEDNKEILECYKKIKEELIPKFSNKNSYSSAEECVEFRKDINKIKKLVTKIPERQEGINIEKLKEIQYHLLDLIKLDQKLEKNYKKNKKIAPVVKSYEELLEPTFKKYKRTATDFIKKMEEIKKQDNNMEFEPKILLSRDSTKYWKDLKKQIDEKKDNLKKTIKGDRTELIRNMVENEITEEYIERRIKQIKEKKLSIPQYNFEQKQKELGQEKEKFVQKQKEYRENQRKVNENNTQIKYLEYLSRHLNKYKSKENDNKQLFENFEDLMRQKLNLIGTYEDYSDEDYSKQDSSSD